MNLPDWLSTSRIDPNSNLSSKLKKNLLKAYLTDSEMRTPFQRDADAILHSPAFRRLAHKTQVFLNPHSDFPRTRMIHSMEVARVGKQLARLCYFKVANLSDAHEFMHFEDALTAACLAHDIGHPAFGHKGEKILDLIVKECEEKYLSSKISAIKRGGFEGNKQNLRVLTGYLIHDPSNIESEIDYINIPLNLTAAVIDGTLKYKSESSNKYPGYYPTEGFLIDWVVNQTKCDEIRNPIATIMEAADDIVNLASDCEDALKLELISGNDLEKILFRSLNTYDYDFEEVDKSYLIRTIKSCIKDDDFTHIKSFIIRGLISQFISNFSKAVKGKKWDKWPVLLHKYLSQSTYPVDKNKRIKEYLNILYANNEKLYNFKNEIFSQRIITSNLILNQEKDAATIINGIWWHLSHLVEGVDSTYTSSVISRLPKKISEKIKSKTISNLLTPGKEIGFDKIMRSYLAVDFIAGMSDRYAISFLDALEGRNSVLRAAS